MNSCLRENYGEKIYKLALDGGFTCPTRDGKLDTRGCIFCSGGSGDFAVPVGRKFIAYFQSFTGTYAPVERLRALYRKTIEHPEIVALSIGTRPDCLSDEVISLLADLNRTKPVWVELGLQTIHESTAEYIRRGYPLAVFDDALRRLHVAGITVIVHMILGLPGETPEMMVETARYIGQSGAEGIKFQLLHVLAGTDLAEDYRNGLFRVLSLEEYIRVLEQCIEIIPADMVIHRLTGDGAKRNLIAPLWSADRAFDRDRVMQGSKL